MVEEMVQRARDVLFTDDSTGYKQEGFKDSSFYSVTISFWS